MALVRALLIGWPWLPDSSTSRFSWRSSFLSPSSWQSLSGSGSSSAPFRKTDHLRVPLLTPGFHDALQDDGEGGGKGGGSGELLKHERSSSPGLVPCARGNCRRVA